MLLAHQAPLEAVEVFEMQPLAVGPVSHDDGVLAIGHGAVDVAAQDQAVIHGDRHVPVDLHAITHFAGFAVAHC